MAETYKRIFPGNWVNHLNAYALPNRDFEANNRSSGDPRDRHHQSAVYRSGWMCVNKVGYSLIEGNATEWDVIVPSPDTRPDDKPRADIEGLFVPEGAYLYRAAIRVVPVHQQPAYYSQGYRNDPRDQVHSGIFGTQADDQLVLTNIDLATGNLIYPAVGGEGSITATRTNTPNDGPVVDGGNNDASVGAIDAPATSAEIPPSAALFQLPVGDEVLTTEDQILKLASVNAGGTAAGEAMFSQLTGGAYVVSEVAYLVPAPVPTLDELHLPGNRYAGYRG